MATSERQPATGPGWATRLDSLERDGHVALGWVRPAIDWLAETTPSGVAHVIDVGAGPGFASYALAERFTDARVTAVDPTPELLDRAVQRAVDRGYKDRFATYLSTLDAAAGSVAPADLVWSSHVVHHLPDPVDGLRAIRGLLRPGGRAAIVEGGLPMRVLPGGYGVGPRSFLGRLEAALNDYYTAEWSLTDQAVGGNADWPVLMAAAGFTDCHSRTFLLDLPAPLDADARQHVVGHFEEVSELIGDRLEPADAAALARLVDPHDEAGLRHRADLFILSASTVHVGTNRPT